MCVARHACTQDSQELNHVHVEARGWYIPDLFM